MYKHLLIPIDGADAELTEKAIASAIEFARDNGARVTFFTAVPEYRLPTEGDFISRRVPSLAEHEERSQAKALAILAPAVERARAARLEADTEYALSDQPWQAIIAAAQRRRCDAIIMASHGRRGLSRLVHGSQTIDVLAHSDIPTLVVR